MAAVADRRSFGKRTKVSGRRNGCGRSNLGHAHTRNERGLRKGWIVRRLVAMQLTRTRFVGLCIIAAGVLAASAFGSYMLGRKHVKDRYEIWYASSATFEATLVDAGQNAMVLERMHAG